MKATGHVLAVILGGLALAAPAVATTDQVRAWGLATDQNAASGQLVNVLAPPGEAPSLVSMPITRRITVLYDTDAGVEATLSDSTQMRWLPWIFRQEPSNSIGGAALGNNQSQRVVKVKADELLAQPSADAMADVLRQAVDRKCTTPAGINTCGAHMAAVDEITPDFSQSPSSTAPDPDNPGVRLAKAMRSLQRDQSPWGGTYASRIQIYIAPGASTSIAAGRGPFRTQGRDRKNHFRNYGWVVRALSRANGAWIEMYHFKTPPTKTGFTPEEWRDVPSAVATFMRERSPGTNPLNSLHVMIGDVAPVNGCPLLRPGPENVITRLARAAITVIPTPETLVTEPDTGSTISCDWQRAQRGPVNQRITANGIGIHRVTGENATDFDRLFRQFYVMS